MDAFCARRYAPTCAERALSTFGATFGDVLARPTHEGGLGFGPGGSSLVLLLILIGAIVWTMRRDQRVRSTSNT